MFIAWALFGALIGAAAAQRKGFSVVAGIIGGVLLGPLAFLMFFISGVTPDDAGNKKCPHCAEWIKADATVCKHCRRDVGRSSGARPPAVRPTGPRPAAK